MSRDNVKKGRVIFHIDMNSFYASVEAAHNPKIKGKPIAIAGNPKERRGIIVTASYEARAQGVKTTMPVWEAKRLCPSLLVIPPNFERYRAASQKLFLLLREYSPLVEPVSIDEGYVDVTAGDHRSNPLVLAKEIQERLLQEYDLPCSIGIAPNKFLAKMASDMKKPLGITVLRKREIEQLLWPLPISEMYGVGKKTAEKLLKLGIETIGDLAKMDQAILRSKFGKVGVQLFERANGIDTRPVDPEAVSEFKSIGNSTTLPMDTSNETKVKTVLTNLSDSVARRMSRKEVYAENIQLTIRYGDRKTVTRSRKLLNPVQTQQEIFEAAMFLWRKYWNQKPVRLLGVTAQELIEKHQVVKQLDLFSYKEDIKKDKLAETVDEIRNKFGDSSLVKGTQLQGDRSELIRDKQQRGTSLEKDFLRDL
ncbi:DNA polymerase IV [Desertibacillus haloalkaliphilus]|uniref:DNA polymerase IV n=1 Tax=Desertibacillus haloalkaliphilus TaxID=1328930 RepID=UPI0028A75CFA|nr:DNA polymerase IV [Desertibacillus haloalkaliphilus]